MDVQLVYVTFPDRASAETIGHRMLDEEHAACVTYWEAGTQYRWEGQIEEATETLALFKTTPEHRDDLVDALEAVHPYEVPCVLPIASQGGALAYGAWVEDEVEA